MQTYADAFARINAHVEAEALFEHALFTTGVAATLAVLIGGGVHLSFPTPSMPPLLVVAVAFLAMVGLACLPSLRAATKRRVADTLMHAPDIVAIGVPDRPTLHAILLPVLRDAGVAPINANATVPVDVTFQAPNRSSPRLLEVRVDGHLLPNLPTEAYAALALYATSSGCWGHDNVTEAWCLDVPDPQPSAHARLRWQATTLSKPAPA